MVDIPDWLLGDIVSMEPFYNMFLGAILVLIGFLSFKYVPGTTLKWAAVLIFIGAGLALLLGYVEVW